MVTVFGYSAPSSDGSAVALLKESWGDVESRDLEQIEIIDIRPHDDLLATWNDFIHTHHYETHASFEDSWIRNHPRRTGEAYENQYMKCAFIDNNPVPAEESVIALNDWFSSLIEVERRSESGR